VIHLDVLDKLLSIAGVVYSLTELSVAAREETLVERPDILNDGPVNDQTACRCEVTLFEICLDRKGTLFVVPGDEAVRLSDYDDVTAEIPRATFDPLSNGFDPVGVDLHIGVNKREDVPLGGLDAGVSRRVRTLDLVLNGMSHALARRVLGSQRPRPVG
jgi:hypothetical protein